MRMVKLEFENRDAGPELSPTRWDCMHIDPDGAKLVMEWYGAFYAGDDYTVYYNGQKVEVDINGEWMYDTVEATVTA